MSKTPIEWSEYTWNPVRGCSRVSPGCVNCYAERQAARFAKLPAEYEGTFRAPGPFHGFAERTKSGPHWTGKVELIPDMLDIPLKRRKPTTYFVNSMSDLFHESLSPSDRWKVFDVMQRAPWHTYQILTKRGEIMRYFMQQWSRILNAVPPANWWLGVSVEDRARKDRIEELRETPAAIRFLSLEPLLEDLGELDLRGIDWVIVGGESGPGARPCDVSWIRSIKDQCAAAGVARFVKQLGAKPHDSKDSKADHFFSHCGHACECCDECPSNDGQIAREDHPKPIILTDRKGGNPDEWPEDLRVRQMPARGRP